jgi:hypothetical protein
MISLKVAVLSVVLCYVAAELTVDPALCKLDMVLCLDNSGSIGALPPDFVNQDPDQKNWKLIIDFSQDLVRKLTVGPTMSQVGLVDFGSFARIQFGLTQYPTQDAVVTAVGTVKYIGDRTNTSGGLFKSRQVLTDPKYGSRDGKSKIIVLITDGIPSPEDTTYLAEAQNCRNDGVRVIVVGVTSLAREAVMKQLAYTPADYVAAMDFNDLDRIQNVVLNDESCKPLPKLTTVATTTTTTTTPAPTEAPIEC